MTVESTISVALKGRLGASASGRAPEGTGKDFALDVAFDVPARGVTALFGPSGCGKTSILRCVAGLHRLAGRIVVGGETWQDTSTGIFRPPHLRHVGYVFQEASLFPHLSVRDNLLFGTRRTSGTAAPQGLDLRSIVGLLGIRHLLDRSPTALSGGERQRIAVGRALLSGPRVLLMDEPLSALDRMTKDEILPYFEMLHETLALPVIYVSHDLGEIERLADTLVLLDNGRVVASGPLHELQTDVGLPLIAAPDATVTLEGRVAGIDAEYGLTRLSLPGAELWVPAVQGDIGAVRRIRIAASDVSLSRTAPTDSTIVNCVPVRIVSIDRRSDKPQVSVILALGPNGAGSRIAARITRKSLDLLGLARGDAIFAQIKSVALVSSRAGKDSTVIEKGKPI